MNNPSSELHTAYFNKLNNAVIYNGHKITVSKWERSGVDTRIEIATTTIDDDSSFTTDIFQVVQDIVVVSSLRVGDERNSADEIANLIVNIIVDDSVLTMDNFYTVGSPVFQGSEVFEDQGYDNTTYRAELSFSHIVAAKFVPQGIGSMKIGSSFIIS